MLYKILWKTGFNELLIKNIWKIVRHGGVHASNSSIPEAEVRICMSSRSAAGAQEDKVSICPEHVQELSSLIII